MKRKDFLKRSLFALGALGLGASCRKDSDEELNENCPLSPVETAGPFPIHSPADLVQQNICGDRTGTALVIQLTVIRQTEEACTPLEGYYVDLWHCDAKGDYSEYGGTNMQSTDYQNVSFLRGRQTTDANGQVQFISIFPGWYDGRAPHIHIEVKSSNEESIRVTQIAFPKDICDEVYAQGPYEGDANTSNEQDNVFSDSLSKNMLDQLTGDIQSGYTLQKEIVVQL
ncbi:hypothetical protein PPO43_08630 [Saprospira sp. CCB-QB6]|uniref:dioxygenase family protein n=1 Tax=Saprospira sp. CCB-QB6 TaxID=3023936 RepID=UPI00234A332A|nr:hypothetical protein [Saprospira sp. CCB-QB6]WCL80044.1 hypothetical protein PPO43_08630 [Saprospira sp. CCB-QB6]